jgi:hypothetical protein
MGICGPRITGERMIGFGAQMLNTEDKKPPLHGLANIVFDGKYLWLSNRGEFGQDTNPLNKFVTVVDPFQAPPRVVKIIDLSAYTFIVVRNIRLSHNGLYIYVCLSGNPGTSGRCLIIDKSTFAIIGNAQITSAGIGLPTPQAGGRAVDAIDDGADHLWVVNSNQQPGNAMERFSLSAVLANGAAPTTSLQIVNFTGSGGIGQHAEELCFGAGFIWTSSSDFGWTITRLNPANGAFTTQVFPSNTNVRWGLSFFFGALWGGDFAGGVFRYDPAQFGTGGFQTDHVDISTPGSNTTLNTFASDGTFLWTGIAVEAPTNRKITIFKLSTTGGSITVLKRVLCAVGPSSTVSGPYQLAFDGQYIWGAQRFESLNGLAYNVPGSLSGNLVKVSITPGAEQQIANWPTGGTI